MLSESTGCHHFRLTRLQHTPQRLHALLLLFLCIPWQVVAATEDRLLQHHPSRGRTERGLHTDRDFPALVRSIRRCRRNGPRAQQSRRAKMSPLESVSRGRCLRSKIQMLNRPVPRVRSDQFPFRHRQLPTIVLNELTEFRQRPRRSAGHIRCRQSGPRVTKFLRCSGDRVQFFQKGPDGRQITPAQTTLSRIRVQTQPLLVR